VTILELLREEESRYRISICSLLRPSTRACGSEENLRSGPKSVLSLKMRFLVSRRDAELECG
jgi:hypothetical protein